MRSLKTLISLILVCASALSLVHGHSFYKPNGGDVRIAWDYNSMHKVAPKGGYPRLLRLQDSSVIVIYETRTGHIEYKRSHDDGKSWQHPVTVFSQFSYNNLSDSTTLVNMANPEIVQLHNGDLLVACNYRPAKAEIAPYSIVVRRSTDNGKTWQAPQTLYNAAPRFTDGCWEPAFLQLPNGELQVYFANENPYQKSEEQEISMVWSTNNGESWSKETKTISFRKDRRDGMPVPILLNDEIVVVIEDNYKTAFKPYIVRTKQINNWSQPVLGDSKQRDYSLARHRSDSVYMGAPYLVSLPNGQTAISYQTTESRSTDWELSTMEVAIGNREARQFKNGTRPFPVPLNREAKWNALALWDEKTIVALASSNWDGGQVAPWIVKGYFIADAIDLSKNDTDSIFIGAKGQTNAKLSFSKVGSQLAIKALVSDDSSSKGDGLILYFESHKREQYKIEAYRNGEYSISRLEKKQWKEMDEKRMGVEVKNEDSHYELLFTVEDKALSNRVNFNAVLSAFKDGAKEYEEAIANAQILDPNTWIELKVK